MEDAIKGKEDISVKIIADSISEDDKRITSFEIELPRMIWAECLTHRMFSRNAASSRAIPVKKKREHVWSDPAMPVFWGKNQSGMQAKEELEGVRLDLAKFAWRIGAKITTGISWMYEKIGVHKQLSNRPMEAFERFKVVVTATEFENFMWLRDHPDAQPEIREVARLMRQATSLSEPIRIGSGEWHLPYIGRKRLDSTSELIYFVGDDLIDLETAKQVSSSCCAQVSYRVLNMDIKKAVSIYGRLVESEPVHASPFEHQATPMTEPSQYPFQNVVVWEEGTTHMDKEGSFWSGNFCGWIQHRQLIPNNAKRG